MAALAAGAVLAGAVSVLSVRGPASGAAPTPPAVSRDWPMFGGTPQRNMVNLVEKNLPDDWDVQANKNVKWVAKLGSRSYGGPTIAGGRLAIETLNIDFDPFLFNGRVHGGLVRLAAQSLVNVSAGGGETALVVLEDF